MRLLVFLALVGCTIAATAKEHDVPLLDGTIIGGTPVDIANYPYEVTVLYSGKHVCAGSIISANWIVTAAHCAEGRWTSNFQLRAGSSRTISGGSRHTVTHIVKHASYDPSSLDYDIALMHVNKAFRIGETGISAVTLPDEESTPNVDLVAAVSGWASLNSESLEELQAVEVPVLSRDICRNLYGKDAITDRMLCAGYATGDINICIGDSGSPLVNDGVLLGFVSWGNGCAQAAQPAVYTDVGALRSWIKEKSGI